MTTTPQSAKWYNRGYLPHFDADYSPQFIICRLLDEPAHSGWLITMIGSYGIRCTLTALFVTSKEIQ
jgi:hypothetical protein